MFGRSIPGINYEDFIDIRELARCQIVLRCIDKKNKLALRVYQEIIDALDKRGISFDYDEEADPSIGELITCEQAKKDSEINYLGYTLFGYMPMNQRYTEVYSQCLKEAIEEELPNIK